MFSKPHPAFQGLPTDAAWLTHLEASLAFLRPPPPSDPAEALAASLREWDRGSLLLANDARYQAKEQYCLRQSFLWEIYQHMAVYTPGDTLSRIIYDRACAVLDQTFSAHRPIDLSFREGENGMQKMLEHLSDVATFYQTALQEEPE